MGAMCSQSSGTPVAMGTKSGDSGSVPKTTYQPEDLVKENPYDFKDEMYFIHLEK
jgi:hypothetical protein